MRLFDLRKWLAPNRRQREPALAGGWAEDEVGPAHHEEPPPDPESAWTPQRIEIVERLWGEGCLWPGGSDEVLRVAVPFGLSAASSLLYLGAGTGGPPLRLAGELGVWVHACEADPVLLSVAARRVQRAGVALAKRATMLGWDPAVPSFRKHAFNHALAIEALRGPRPEDTVAAMCAAVRPGGQIGIVETIAPQPLAAHDPLVAAWSRLERRDLPVAGVDWVMRPLARLGWEVRVNEDVSARHVRLAVTGWKRLVREMRQERPPPRRAAAVVTEAELWLRRIQLLRSGQLRVMRWLAISTAAPGG